MSLHNCPKCRFRAAYDNTPKSLIGRLWRWHIGWCPGWKRYVTDLSDSERSVIEERYQIRT
jgi:hypothetical protein